ncbi:MAG: NAD-dependent epimerase/dehydratase family protein [Bacillati bacterium ANGP1]|uniref:NAD-dependent epimerase/dehydratase family protein n=1 Tax=Candidatus Segetimicrobium genomatis TaxID=2569760 RepID=A0A537KTI4_9BACT|nr:MAG: NAD-dependent epimerase/dehydratase family protein [Terrabacteria group bacterium ANGP1]
MEGLTALVTGGAGFVGANLVREALRQGCARVVVVDNLLSSERENLAADPRVDFVLGSIADDSVLGELEDEFDCVFHLATYHGNQSSIADPLADHDNNLITTLKLYERLTGFRRPRKVVYAASGCTLAPHTFDRAEATIEDGPVPLELDSPYQISKVVGEFYSVYYHTQHGLPTVRARFQNVYGPGEILGAGEWRGTPATVWRNVTPTFVYRALKRLSLTVENGGSATRDFIYVDDIVRGLILCATTGQPGDVYNLASGVETSILDLATLVNQLTGNPAPIDFRPRRDWDRSGKRFGSTEKAKRALGFEAHVALREGVRRTIDWTREHLPLIDRCVQKHAARIPLV